MIFYFLRRLKPAVTIFFLFIFPLSTSAAWTTNNLGTIQGLHGMTQSGGSFFAVGNTGQTIRSTDAGATWSLYDNNANVYWLDVDADGDVVRMVGESGTMRESEDGGKTWLNISLGISDTLHDIDTNGNYGLVVGTNGRIVRLHPSAKLWQTVTSPTTLSLFRAQIIDQSGSWVVGQSGTLLYTPDYGVSWSNKGKVASDDLYGVWFTSATNGFVVGKNATFRKTTDAGASWTDVSVSGLINQTLYDIRGSGDRMVAVGDKVILDSTDGGLTWTATPYATENYRFYDAYFDTDGNIWVVGTQDDVKSVIVKWEPPQVEETPPIVPSEPPASQDVQTSESSTNTLIKLACTTDAGVNDPCKAVYFYGSDGKRHAFPNEKVFFTWYDNFDAVVTVSQSFMSSLSLGKNVTYHPGTKLVKFQSVPTVYAVSKSGELRAVATESVAIELYSSDWNKKVDDIPDAFFGNYTFGAKIEKASDYDVAAAKSSVTGLDQNF